MSSEHRFARHALSRCFHATPGAKPPSTFAGVASTGEGAQLSVPDMPLHLADGVGSVAPAGRWGNLNELKGIAVFLASDASSFVNGQVIYVDGGLLSSIG